MVVNKVLSGMLTAGGMIGNKLIVSALRIISIFIFAMRNTGPGVTCLLGWHNIHHHQTSPKSLGFEG